ncbi:hypothetical protein ACEQ6A_12970 [Rhizobium brockwellii]|uniref:hypothetical protein n=1 Tax=Rhizobium brockwellii TaxID=3019932 RepID=UPI003F9A320E
MEDGPLATKFEINSRGRDGPWQAAKRRLPTWRRRRANAWEDRGGGGGGKKAGCPSMREHLKYPFRSDGGWPTPFGVRVDRQDTDIDYQLDRQYQFAIIIRFGEYFSGLAA